jgi:beta-glucosidase
VEFNRPGRAPVTVAVPSDRNPASSAAFGALETPEALSDVAIEAKARALLAELTFEEKLGLMDGDAPFWSGLGEMSAPGGYGSRPWVAGAVARLGIPGIRFADGPRGIVLKGATTFPVTMARGATFDTDLEERVGDVIGRELRALGGNLFGGVCINLLRHPAWGRAQETYGEDSFHLGVLGAALARGVQRHAMACVKHYALNSMENARQTIDVTADDRTLHEVYLAHFKRVVDAGVAAVMSAYNTVNGEWAGQNRVLLTGILKEMWGFSGLVMTDFIAGMRDARKAVLAGQDLEMPFELLYHRDLKGLVERGEVPRARIDDAALRLLRQQVRFGQGRDPSAYAPAVVGSPAHRAVAREVAEKSIVLLKNDGGLLPLKGVRRLLVVGRLAAVPNTGDGGSSNTQPAYVVTLLDGLRAAFANTVEYDEGGDPIAAAARAKSADAVVLVVGYTHADEGEFIPPDQLAPYADSFPKPTPEEQPIADRILDVMGGAEGGFSPGGDRKSLSLSAHDEALILAVAAANPRIVVAIMAGSAVITEAWRARVPAILMLWYPGMEGGHALAGILAGKVNPSGRLPCIFPKRAEDLSFFDRDATAITYDLWHGYRKLARDGAVAAFPFGFGLSYTHFACGDLRLSATRTEKSGTIEATVAVTNSGAVAGEEVVQLYVAALGSKVERAPFELKAFARVALQPGETRSVRLVVPVAELAWYDSGSGWVVEAIEYEVIVGRHAADEAALRARFRVAA